jgi:hypothetical protein
MAKGKKLPPNATKKDVGKNVSKEMRTPTGPKGKKVKK